MNISNKIWLAIIAIIIAVFWIMHMIIVRELDAQRLINVRLELALSECSVERRDANAAIERQNKAVEAVRVDTVVVEKRINNVIDKYSYIRETVRASVERDGTCENKINNIDYALRRFGGVELRPASGD
jgi:septal ring factor EnvC (AmiA/AmiB activator)